jgi:hypothetical protein
MKNRKSWLILFFLFLLTACSGPTAGSSPAVGVLTDYFNAFVARDEEKMSGLICPDWETDALLEYDSFQATETKVEGLACKQSGTEGEVVLAACDGKIVARYVDQTQEFDLSQRTYRLEKVGQDWKVCGYSVQ